MNREAHKSRQRKSATSQPAAGSHGAASSSRPASTSVQSTFCRCVLVASCGGGRSSPRFGDERRTRVPPLYLCSPCACQARLQQGTTNVLPCCSLTLPTVHSRQSTTTARHRVTASSFCARSRGSRAGTLWPSAARVRRALLRTPATVPSPHTFWPA